MSQPNIGPAEPGHVQQYLTFVLSGEVFAIGILAIKEIIEYTRPTAVPMSPEYVRGVINLRGAVVPIIDLRCRFGLGNSDFGPTTVVIVVRATTKSGERTVGMVVDAVSEVYNVDMTAAKPPPDVCANTDTVFVKALATVGEKMLILLDIDRLIGNSIMDEVMSATAAA